MSNIKTIYDFDELTSNITSFSHAYLFNVNSLEKAFPFIKIFARRIICPNSYQENCSNECDICRLIDNNIYDDLYIVNPKTVGINIDEIENLFDYMGKKSLRPDGKRVYIIYGFERLSKNISNKILKFLEEPSDNIYALLMTENINQILTTIISRCQVIDLFFPNEVVDENLARKMRQFLECVIEKREKSIAYVNYYWQEYLCNRLDFFTAFEYIEKCISKSINIFYNKKNSNTYDDDNNLLKISINSLVKILEITNNLKSLIKKNINLNLLLDRYIIEVSKELK